MMQTRLGRLIKHPVKYEPEETAMSDDFKYEDHDSGMESDVSSTVEFSDDDDVSECESDDSFICGSEDEIEYEDDDSGDDEEMYETEDETSDEET